MEVKIITGTAEEIAKVLQAIENSKEHKVVTRKKSLKSLYQRSSS